MTDPLDLSTEAAIIEAGARVGDRYLALLAGHALDPDEQLWLCRVAYAALLQIQPEPAVPVVDLAALPAWLRDLCGRPDA